YIDQYNIKTVVLGLPKHMNGDIGIRGEISLEFKEILENERKDVTVVLIDERLTTVISQRSMTMMNTSKKKKKGIVDQIAAQQILQSYLDSKKR
ncbi:MAG: Holliday junction resolvase RuvX, partial [Erysipelotrichaceae bacterium]|nr:Holliday junction resolvase RuvX [Erysipelotrichaceae bacterium]